MGKPSKPKPRSLQRFLVMYLQQRDKTHSMQLIQSMQLIELQ